MWRKQLHAQPTDDKQDNTNKRAKHEQISKQHHTESQRDQGNAYKNEGKELAKKSSHHKA